jgi:hypothetical protein
MQTEPDVEAEVKKHPQVRDKTEEVYEDGCCRDMLMQIETNLD